MAKLSVIIPVYRVEQYLPRCVDSVMRQTLSDLEILLIDDGSPDGCGRMCDEYAARDGRIRVLHKENAGLCAARNDGIDMATGTYVAFVDSDDWLEPDYYEQMVRAAEKYDPDLVTGNYYRDVGPYCTVKHSVAAEETTDDPERILRFQLGTLSMYYCDIKDASMGPCWNKIFNRDFLLEHHIYFDDVRTFEDILYSFKAFWYARRVTCIPVQGYHYRYVEASIMNGYDPGRIEKDRNTMDILYCMGADMFYPGAEAYKAIYAFTANSLRITVWNGLFGRENKVNLREKLDTLRGILVSDHYRTAFNRCPPRMVDRRLIPCALLKTRSAFYFYILYVLQCWKRRLVGVRKS